MPPNPQKPRIVLDWFTVSYRSVFLAGLAVLLVAAAAVWWIWLAPSGDRREAQEAIRRASDKVAEASTYPAAPRLDEFRGSARVALDEARTAFGAKRWEDARYAAMRSESLAQKAIDVARGEGAADREVRLSRMEGDVRVKRIGEFAWEPAERNMVLRVGDQIKTAENGSAEILYFSGTRTTIERGSLLEIRQIADDPATNVRQVKEKLSWGEILASTQRNARGSFHEVATEAVTARVEEGGDFRVAVDKDKKTAAFDALTGTVQLDAGDRKESLAPGERVRATAEGRLFAKENLPGVPRLIAPVDQRVFVHEDPKAAQTTLSWEPVEGAQRYRLVISNRPLFASPLYEADRRETTVVVDAVPAGEYFWRVAAVGPEGATGPFSEPRRFRITSQKIRDREDSTAPELQVTEKVQTGSMLILNGKTEPGAVLWVDDEKVEVSEDGSFYAVVRLRKEGVNEIVLVVQDAAGNQRKVSQKAFVDAF
jgi:hypothetical protein